MEFRTSRSEALVQPYHFYKDTKCQEQFGYDCDINNIVKGMTSPMPIRQPVISDEVKKFSPDMYEQALYTKAAAENAFNELPSDVREFFHNSPKEMLAFIGDSKNVEKCIELGLMVRDEAKEFVSNVSTIAKNVSANNSEKTAKAVTSKEES